ncbi:MAG: hypothetical protein Q8O03_09475 [Nanoarchaeota archaeon]|nr:hypothetical protein [Nanoarchaeota archaeon]
MSIERIVYDMNPVPPHYRDDISKKLDETYDAFSYARKSVVNTGNPDEDKCLHHIFFLSKMACYIAGMSLEESILHFFKEQPIIKNKKIYCTLVKKGYLRKKKYDWRYIYFPTEKACEAAHLYDKKKCEWAGLNE